MPNKPISKKEQLAWDFAREKHKGQVRKFVNLPYFDAHVQKVNGILKMHTIDEDMLCASILHDCIEDTSATYEEIYSIFGKRVADLVEELTSDEYEMANDYGGNKESYLTDKMLSMSDDALIIKFCDRLQNISDAFTASEKFRNNYYRETFNIIKTLKDNRRMNKIQMTLVHDIEEKLSNIKALFHNESVKSTISLDELMDKVRVEFSEDKLNELFDEKVYDYSTEGEDYGDDTDYESAYEYYTNTCMGGAVEYDILEEVNKWIEDNFIVDASSDDIHESLMGYMAEQPWADSSIFKTSDRKNPFDKEEDIIIPESLNLKHLKGFKNFR